MPQKRRKACPRGENDCPIYSEIKELRQTVEILSEQIRTDALTGLFNRRHLLDSLHTEMERTQRSNQPTSLILLDIDHFKSVNDRFGHINGDKVLKHIAKALTGCVRKLDVVCRYGGEEFAIVLPSTPILIAAQVAERIRSAIASHPVKLSDTNLSVTTSAGVTGFYPGMKSSAEDLVSSADEYLYLAKDRGRNQVCVRPAPSFNAQNITHDERKALFEAPAQDTSRSKGN